ncbi:MAG: methyltransferase domain-containing protein [Pseudomonadota bacterium]
MYRDVLDLHEFYRDRLGLVAQRLLRRRLRQMWPDLAGQSIMGFGYAGPLLKAYEEQTDYRFLVMPAAQGVMAWPDHGKKRAVILAHEHELPFEDASLDRIILCHAVECSTQLPVLMQEIWRVLAGQGRLMVIAPNRRGFWARGEHTPFGHGVPFSMGQLVNLLHQQNFVPERSAKAVFIPPLRQRFLLSTAPAFEEFGERWFEALAGLNLVEASKQVFAGIKPQREAQRTGRPVLVPTTAAPRPASARTSRRHYGHAP